MRRDQPAVRKDKLPSLDRAGRDRRVDLELEGRLGPEGLEVRSAEENADSRLVPARCLPRRRVTMLLSFCAHVE